MTLLTTSTSLHESESRSVETLLIRPAPHLGGQDKSPAHYGQRTNQLQEWIAPLFGGGAFAAALAYSGWTVLTRGATSGRTKAIAVYLVFGLHPL